MSLAGIEPLSLRLRAENATTRPRKQQKYVQNLTLSLKVHCVRLSHVTQLILRTQVQVCATERNIF